MAVRVVCDSVCAPSLPKAEKLGITIVPINIHFGKEVHKDLLGLPPEDFYKRLPTVKELPTTSAPSPERFKKVFKEILAAGDECICLTMTGKLSLTHQTASKARDAFKKEEAARIRVVDTMVAGAAASLLTVHAAEMARTGESLAVITEQVEELRAGTKLVVMFDTLKYIEKSGKVGKVAAVAGNLFRVKPLIVFRQSKPDFFGRARGQKQAVRMILDEFEKDTAGKSFVRLAVTHANARANVQPFIDAFKEKHPAIEADIVPFTSAMGSHAGPGVIGIGYIHADL